MSAEDLLGTREGMALANAAWEEGSRAALNAAAAHKPGTPWTKPLNPYSVQLLADIAVARAAVEAMCDHHSTESHGCPAGCFDSNTAHSEADRG